MAGTLVEEAGEGAWKQRLLSPLSLVIYTLSGGTRGLNTEERVLGMNLRDCHRHMAPQFSFEYGDSPPI